MNETDLKYYLQADRIALRRQKVNSLSQIVVRKIIAPDYVFSFQEVLRKAEYYKNCDRGILSQINYAMKLRELHYLSMKLGYYIHPNNFGPGLSISHPGFIIIAETARIGSNCRVHPGVVIGTIYDSDRAATLGDNIYIGPGVKIYGPIEISDNIAIGANSVVNHSFTEQGITIAGIPARKISNKGSLGLWVRATEILDKEIHPKTLEPI
jgi:serine O-acetyltransferase